ncbi:MAG: GAF domain-containing sensor histidine kinase [bacterium]
MGIGLVATKALGIELATLPLLLVALFILGYNFLFKLWHRRFAHDPARQTEEVLRRFTCWQVACDFVAVILVLCFTGGASSPFVFIFIFHIIFASILLRHYTAYGFAAFAAAGVGLLSAAESAGWLPTNSIGYQGQVVALAVQPLPRFVTWALFTALVFICALATTNIMEMVRQRIHRLADLSEETFHLNRKLESLHAIGQSIIAVHRLDQVLELVCWEMAKVMKVQGAAVKLLSRDRRLLRFTSAYGLPASIWPGREIAVADSPLNRRVIEGEPYVAGDVTPKDQFQLREELIDAHIKSVLFVPLEFERKVIGILSVYSQNPNQFSQKDVDFLVLAAELVAIAVENARVYEAIADLDQEREQFTLRVAHNLRAPLAAMLSILEVVRDGHLGDLNTDQLEYLRRLDRRARSLKDLVDELLVLAENQGKRRLVAHSPLDLSELVQRIRRTFQNEAAQKNLRFEMNVPTDLPEVLGDRKMIEQLLENLVSNAIKYTPAEGRVSIAVEPGEDDSLRLIVSDTGIGIPTKAQPNLFTEFYRAENAKRMEGVGTGLGLAIVKEIVDRHGGHIKVLSEEGAGACFVIDLPGAGGSFPGRSG